MVKNNEYIIIKENKAQIEEVREIENEVPSFEEFMRNYEGGVNYADLSSDDIGKQEGYGPCKNSLCGCSCSSSTCNCSSAEIFAHKEADLKAGSYLAVARARDGKVSGEVSGSIFRIEDSNKEVRLFSSSAGGEVGKDGIKGRLGFDVANYKSDGVQARVGVNVDSGISTSNDTFEAKALGFGVSVGNQTGISTPFGEVKVDTEDCVIQ
jgi:hypothetical protein